jgi:serine/threonine protein kinase
MKSVSVQAKKVSERFDVPESWELDRYLGSGAYAAVAAFKVCGVDVAVKKVTGVFDHPVLALRTLREVKLLIHLQHPNVLSIRELFVEGPDFKDAYICLERMDADLAQLIQSHKDKGQMFTDYQTQCIVYQIMRGLFCLRMAAVIHRDLKPSNILIKAQRADSSEGNVKIADLGLARSVDAAEDSHDVQALTEYVVTRFYRAPEVVLTATRYTYTVDIWSVGCIMGEMLSGEPLFKGKDSLDQIRKIVTVLGMPSEDDMSWIPVSSPSWKFVMRCSQNKANGEAFQRLLKAQGGNPNAMQLLEEMLKFDPSRRISVEQALNHRYVQGFTPGSEHLRRQRMGRSRRLLRSERL